MPDRPPLTPPLPDREWIELAIDPSDAGRLDIDRKLFKNLALVLAARGIDCQQLPPRKPRQLFVQRRDLMIARHEITLYLRENQALPTKPDPFGQTDDNSLQTIWVLIMLGIFHNLTNLEINGFGHTPIDWLQLGSVDAGLIRSGDWWRTITALTLHADGQHLMGNLLIGGYFVARLCRLLGGGLGWSLILWSGILGNVINSLLHSSGHRSIGASTALFGAIGAAGMIGLLRHRQNRSRYWILPFAAALGLLAMLGAGGTDKTTDIGAHLFGFICGIGLGAGAWQQIVRSGLPTAKMNLALATAALSTPIGAWLLALTVG